MEIPKLSYQLIPTLIFFLAAFAAILMVLKKLPIQEDGQNQNAPKPSFPAHEVLAQKGLPALGFSKIKHYAVFYAKKIWMFILEAKDIAPTGVRVLKIKRLFAAKMRLPEPALSEENDAPETSNLSEQDYLEAIKKEPKNLELYSELGKYYLKAKNLPDAKDIYLYLTSHASGRADYWANLGYTAFKLKDFKQAAEAYSKSVSLDSSQPNRYYNLAQSYKALGQTEDAAEALDKALQMDPQNFKFLELKGRLKNS